MSAKRLFTFGCSFTEWYWPTWANIIAHDLGLEFYNYGQSGIGNVGIAHRIVQADLTHKFQESDIILVVWSSWNREDRIDENFWRCGGNVFNNQYYDRNFLKNQWSTTDSIVKNSHAIISANKTYNIKFNGHILALGGTEEGGTESAEFKSSEYHWWQFYQPHLPDDGYFLQSANYAHYETIDDDHPRVSSHLSYVNNVIYPKLNYILKKETVEFYTALDNKISQLPHKSLDDAQNAMNQLWERPNVIQ